MAFKRRKLEIVPPFVSLADIVFNLILFFLILAKTQDEKTLEWEKTQAPGTKELAKARVAVTVDKNGKMYLNGDEIGLRDLPERLDKEFANQTEKKSVLLRIHKETLAATYKKIMEAVSQAGCEIAHVLEDEGSPAS